MKRRGQIGVLILLIFVLLVFFRFQNILPKTVFKYKPQSAIIRQPINRGKLMVNFPNELAINKDTIDCFTQAIIKKGSPVLTAGTIMDHDATAYYIGTSQTQVTLEGDEDVLKGQRNLCTNGSLVTMLFEVSTYSKDDYMKFKDLLMDEKNMLLESDSEIKIGNIKTQIKVYSGFHDRVFQKSYHVNVGSDYYIITKPIYDETVNTIFDPKLLNDTVEYIFSHLEFQPV